MTLCECGCGQEVKPGNRFIHGHYARLHPPMKIPENVKKSNNTRKKHKDTPVPEPQLCECGCGELAKRGNRFIAGHNACKTPWKQKSEPQLCECGCGEYTNAGNRFIHGHHQRGKPVPIKTRLKISESNRGVPKSSAHVAALVKSKRQEKCPLTDGWNTERSMNKKCTNYIGDIAERALSMMYEDVQIMPRGNPGYDVICKCGIKVDAKGSATGHKGYWRFNIKKNRIAEHFLCIAFDNRDDTTPQHVWMIPGHVVNHLTGLKIRKSKLYKWSQYELPIDDVVACCDELKLGE